MCWPASAMTANTWATYSSGTASWNRSLMLFTNTSRGRRHRSGRSNADGAVRGSKPCSYAWPGTPRNRSATLSA